MPRAFRSPPWPARGTVTPIGAMLVSMKDYFTAIKPVYWQQALACLITVAVYIPLIMVMPDVLLRGAIPWIAGMFIAHVCLGWLGNAPTFRRGFGRISGYAFVITLLVTLPIGMIIAPAP